MLGFNFHYILIHFILLVLTLLSVSFPFFLFLLFFSDLLLSRSPLNDVDERGQTVFLMADNTTITAEVTNNPL